MAREVGIRQFKAEASALFDAVEHGETLTVTRRGKPVAHVVPAGAPEGIQKLVEAGIATWGGGRLTELPTPVKLRGEGPTAADYVREGRR